MSALSWPAAVDIREVGPRDGLQIETRSHARREDP